MPYVRSCKIVEAPPSPRLSRASPMPLAAGMAPNPNPSGGVEHETSPQALEAVERLRSVPPPRFLSPSPDLSRLAREASAHLFASLLPVCPKSLPLDRLLTDENFDAEQIWHQIELQSRPLVSTIRRDVRRLEKMGPEELLGVEVVHEDRKGEEEENDLGAEENDVDVEEEDDMEEDEEDREGEEEAERDAGKSELGYLEGSEEDGDDDDEGSEQEGEEDYDEDEHLIENELYSVGNDHKNKDSDDDLFARYEDFYGGKNKKPSQSHDRKKIHHSSKKSELDHEENESPGGSDADVHNTDDGEDFDVQDNGELSTYERQRKELQLKIEQMEKENLGPKSWTMLGEVTGAKRPKNSALEVDLDFEHNKERPPITTEENTADIEDIILKRIREGHLDEVQRAPKLPTKAPKELKELDDTKSRKGLAEIYEEEYSQKAGLAAAPLSFSDEQKKEASFLFKKLCLKLDALSHFHFAPKPVIEDMSIQANVPALAMEEIAPLAVSDAAMLAPEEIFSGKGDFKEEKELTQADRKRRRAKKKRKFKGRHIALY
ncbi:hypothetical protein Taro_031521 [Colocasia esculenta]|uniref:U3 small nucleolar ribonucleoprotein protein MPP10 n=1 Tax=Colocasia esculenta TaxID=4460 RepID=A0A843VQ86_COLES|nr:hypothetical protein [Colocasia esculenta]